MSDDVDEPFGSAVLEELRSRRLAEARDAYKEMLGKLWAGNAGGLVTTVTAMGFLAKDNPTFAALALPSFAFFAIGLIALGSGAFFSLISDAQTIRDLEDARGLLDVKVGSIRRPSIEAGLAWTKPTTLLALVAAIALVIGLAAAFIELLHYHFHTSAAAIPNKAENMSLLPWISLIFSVLAIVITPFMTWRILAKRQLASTMRQAWMKEFREAVAELLSSHMAFQVAMNTFTTDDPEKEKQKAELTDRMSLPYFNLRLLIGESSHSNKSFITSVVQLMKQEKTDDDIVSEAVTILKEERATSQSGR